MKMKKQTTILYSALMLVMASAFLLSCKKREFDTPPIKEIPQGQILTISQLKARFNDTTGAPVRFNEDLSVYAVVTMDDKSGNIYKAAYVQDATGAINLRLLSSGGLYVGDSIRIYLRGTVLSKYNGLMQLDSVDVDNNVIKQKSAVNFAPQVVTIDQITPDMQSKLIKLENVQFSNADLGKSYANAATQSTENRMLSDCEGREIIVRTSGYASFAGTPLPQGKGSLVAIVGLYNTEIQLYVRTLGEVKMDQPRCAPGFIDPVTSFSDDFSSITVDNATLATYGWMNIPTKGSAKWSAQIYQSEKYAEATSYGSSDAQNEIWLISPRVVADGSNSLSFRSAVAFWKHDPMTVWIATNFDGSNAATANWIQITNAILAGSANGNFTWVNSGTVNLTGYLPQGYTGNFVIGYKYVGSASAQQTTNFRIDDVQIF